MAISPLSIFRILVPLSFAALAMGFHLSVGDPADSHFVLPSILAFIFLVIDLIFALVQPRKSDRSRVMECVLGIATIIFGSNTIGTYGRVSILDVEKNRWVSVVMDIILGIILVLIYLHGRYLHACRLEFGLQDENPAPPASTTFAKTPQESLRSVITSRSEEKKPKTQDDNTKDA